MHFLSQEIIFHVWCRWWCFLRPFRRNKGQIFQPIAQAWHRNEGYRCRVGTGFRYPTPAFSSEHCVPCAVMYDMASILCDATMSPSPLSHTHVNNMYYSSLHHKLEPSVQDVFTKKLQTLSGKFLSDPSHNLYE